LKPSHLAPVLQYGSGSTSGCMAKVLGVSTPLLLYNTQFIFHILDTVHKSHKQECTYIVLNSSVGKGRT